MNLTLWEYDIPKSITGQHLEAQILILGLLNHKSCIGMAYCPKKTSLISKSHTISKKTDVIHNT